MSVEFFEEITGREGDDDLETNRRHRRTFRALTDHAEDGSFVVLSYVEVPQLNDPYFYHDEETGEDVIDALSVAIARRCRNDDENNPRHWIIEVDYAGIDDPVSVPAEVDISPTRYQKALVDDVNGEPVVNAAGDPFADGITVDRTRFTIVIEQNVESFPITTMATYQDTLNEQAFMGLAPGTCKLALGAKRIRRAGTLVFYYRRRAEIDVDLNGWKIKPRNAGFRAIMEEGGDPVVIIDAKTGAKPTTPVLLDASGAVLATGGTPILAGPLSAGFDGYETRDWGPLGLEYE